MPLTDPSIYYPHPIGTKILLDLSSTTQSIKYDSTANTYKRKYQFSATALDGDSVVLTTSDTNIQTVTPYYNITDGYIYFVIKKINDSLSTGAFQVTCVHFNIITNIATKETFKYYDNL